MEPQINSQMREVLAKSQELAPPISYASVPLEEARCHYAQERAFWNEGGPQLPRVEDLTVPGPVGPVPIRIYHPEASGNRPALEFLHGGGFVVGSIDTHDRIMRELAQRSGYAVVGVDYSLSPEQKFPVALEESLTVLRWIRANGSDHGLDPNRLVVGGDSGGASLTMGVAVSLQPEVPAWLQGLLLYYGWFGLQDSGSGRLYGGTEDGLTKSDRDFYRTSYLTSMDDLMDTRLDVLRADLQGLPATRVIACDLDPLLDDSTTLAALLRRKGVPCELSVHEGVLHGFLHYSRMMDAAQAALDEGAEFLKKVLGQA